MDKEVINFDLPENYEGQTLGDMIMNMCRLKALAMNRYPKTRSDLAFIRYANIFIDFWRGMANDD